MLVLLPCIIIIKKKLSLMCFVFCWWLSYKNYKHAKKKNATSYHISYSCEQINYKRNLQFLLLSSTNPVSNNTQEFYASIFTACVLNVPYLSITYRPTIQTNQKLEVYCMYWYYKEWDCVTNIIYIMFFKALLIFTNDNLLSIFKWICTEENWFCFANFLYLFIIRCRS